MDRIPWYPGTRHISRWGEKVVRLILSSVSLSNNIVYDNNGSIAGRKRAFINLTLCFKQCHFHTGKDGAKKWLIDQLVNCTWISQIAIKTSALRGSGLGWDGLEHGQRRRHSCYSDTQVFDLEAGHHHEHHHHCHHCHNDCHDYPNYCHKTKWQSTWRGAKPAAAESAAHIHHVVTEHLAPAFSAAGRFVESESGKLKYKFENKESKSMK